MVMPPARNGDIPGTVPDQKDRGAASDAVKYSVVDVPDQSSLVAGSGEGYLVWMGQMADGIMEWGKSPKLRDRQLRDFITKENYFGSALASVCARNAAFSWSLQGPARTVKQTQQMLLLSNRGLGWESLATQVSMDLYTQDLGAYVELIREGGAAATETSPVINLAHLDAARMYPTGNPEEPYWYNDRRGRWHALKWFQVVNLMEMPSAQEFAAAGVFFRLQYSAATRVLRSAQILRNVALYTDEKTSGRFEQAIHLVKGITAKQITEAVRAHRVRADESGLQRYIQTPIVGSVDPKADVGATTLELKSLPDGWDEEKVMKWYIAALALAFLTDYQEFAPLPGGNLGTSNQSQVLHMKSRGKGPALFQKLITHLMNFQGALPQNVTFLFDEQDAEADKMAADLALVRATERQVRIVSGEIDPEGARQLAVDAGDLSPELFDKLQERADLTTDITANDEERAPEASRDDHDPDTIADDVEPVAKALAAAILEGFATKDGDETMRQTIGAYLQTRLHRAFTTAADDIAGLGLMNTDERINLSGIIGDTLGHFAQYADLEMWDVVHRRMRDDDVQTLMKLAEKAYAARKPRTLKASRIAMEREVEDPIGKMLDGVYAKVRARLRRGQRVA